MAFSIAEASANVFTGRKIKLSRRSDASGTVSYFFIATLEYNEHQLTSS